MQVVISGQLSEIFVRYSGLNKKSSELLLRRLELGLQSQIRIGKGKKLQKGLNNIKNRLIRIIVTLIKKKVLYNPNTYKFYISRLKSKVTETNC